MMSSNWRDEEWPSRFGVDKPTFEALLAKIQPDLMGVRTRDGRLVFPAILLATLRWLRGGQWPDLVETYRISKHPPAQHLTHQHLKHLNGTGARGAAAAVMARVHAARRLRFADQTHHHTCFHHVTAPTASQQGATCTNEASSPNRYTRPSRINDPPPLYEPPAPTDGEYHALAGILNSTRLQGGAISSAKGCIS